MEHVKGFLIQVKVVENHQNGKDTHVRGLRIYARDERDWKPLGEIDNLVGVDDPKKTGSMPALEKLSMISEPDWMAQPESR
jgi:anaphase-promoting complex subunit 10